MSVSNPLVLHPGIHSWYSVKYVPNPVPKLRSFSPQMAARALSRAPASAGNRIAPSEVSAPSSVRITSR